MMELALPASLKDLGIPSLKVPQVVFEDGAENIPLANMLVEIIKSNVKRSGSKATAYMTMKLSLYLSITDAGAEISLVFDTGDLNVCSGKCAKPQVSIITDSATLMDLASLKTTVLGLPNLFDEKGKNILKKLISGELKLKGIFFNIPSLMKLGKILAM